MATQGPQETGTVTAAPSRRASSLVVCSLESWSRVRRRIRILVDELVELDPDLRVLFVAPAVDVPHELRHGNLTALPSRRILQVHPRITVLRPRKWLPRVLGPAADRSLGRQVARTAAELGLVRPLVWVNDASYARFARGTGWPTVYDITDDWLLAPLAPRQRARLEADEALLLSHSDAVVVCSEDLVRSRGRLRPVELIPNGVDVDLFRAERPRPPALPRGTVALYVGTLHEERIDVPLVLELAAARPDLQVVLVGPSSLPGEVAERLRAVPTVHLLGPQAYDEVPAFMQHADVVIVPHLVNPFTESLDPIKAYECLAAGRPTVATPVAGFRHLAGPVTVADRAGFVAAVGRILDRPADAPAVPPADVPTWRQRAEAMGAVLDRARAGAAS